MSLVQRYDNGKISKFAETSQGFLKIPGRLTRTGILEYLRSDGSVQRELKHPDEVFNADSLATLAQAPVTDLHPASMVCPRNVRQLQIGVGSETPKRDGIYVSSDITVMDESAIEAVKRGDRKEISLGYHCKLDHTPGVWEGQRYDAVQRGIKYNHIAIGPAGWGRAGSEISLRLDGSDACTEFDTLVSDVTQENQPEEKTDSMDELEIKLDGVTVKVSKLAAELIAKEIAAIQAKLDATEGKLGAVESSAKDLQTALDVATDPKAFQARVDARAALEGSARSILGESEKFDGLSDRSVRVKALAELDPKTDYKDQSDDYVKGAFGHVSSQHRTDASLGTVREDAEKAKGSGSKDAKAVRADAIKAKQDRYKNFDNKESK